MPMKSTWVEPEVLLTHRGVTVYYTYKNDDFDQGIRRYWFTVNANCGEGVCNCEELLPNPGPECSHVFDVRTLSVWPPRAPACRDIHSEWVAEQQAVKDAIFAAIDRGELTRAGDRLNTRSVAGDQP